jgi:hypothetical protein
MWLIWGAYALLALAIAGFAYTINRRPDVGAVWGATILFGMAGTAACLALLGGSALGIYAMVGQPACRRPACVLTMVTGVIGGTFLGWIAWGFWTN